MNEVFEVDGIRYSYARLELVLYGTKGLWRERGLINFKQVGKGG